MTASVTWLGHSTGLIEQGGARVLTDPLLRSRMAHLTRRTPAIDPASLGPLDAVLVSHVHRDHLDLPTLRRLELRGPLVVPEGAAPIVAGLGDVRELAAGASLEVAGARIEATPAVHAARRGLRGPELPSLGFVVEAGARIYFAGDTELFDGLSSLAPLDLALIPVWGWGTSAGSGHLEPREAAEALRLVEARLAVPIHWGTYFPIHLGRSGHRLLEDPPHEFARHAKELAPGSEVRILEPGGRVDVL